MNKYFLALVGLTLILFVACSSEKNGEKPLAKVGSAYLYPSDLKNVVMPGMSDADSAMIVRNYVEDWVRRRLLVEKANENVEVDKAELEKKVKDYEESLLIYAYENELIRQKLDTTVSIGQISDYYKKHQANFDLKFDIVKLNYVKVKSNAPGLKDLRAAFTTSQTSPAALYQMCKANAQQFALNDSVWYVVDEIGNIIPPSYISAARSKGISEYQDSNFVYLLNVKDYMVRGALSPLGVVKEDIYKLIVNQRKVEMIKATHDQLFKEGLNDGAFELYIDK